MSFAFCWVTYIIFFLSRAHFHAMKNKGQGNHFSLCPYFPQTAQKHLLQKDRVSLLSWTALIESQGKGKEFLWASNLTSSCSCCPSRGCNSGTNLKLRKENLSCLLKMAECCQQPFSGGWYVRSCLYIERAFANSQPSASSWRHTTPTSPEGALSALCFFWQEEIQRLMIYCWTLTGLEWIVS